MSDISKHLTYFKVENFKRFESFEMKDLGQFNLIVGDNNTGKTSALEALLVDEYQRSTLANLLIALKFKKIASNYKVKDLEQFVNKQKSLTESIVFVKFQLKSDEERFVTIEFNNQTEIITVKKSLVELDQYSYHTNLGIGGMKISFIPFYKGHDEDLTNYYSQVIQKNRALSRRLIDSMRLMIPDFEGMELSAPYSDQPPYIIISERNKDATLPLGMYGEGSIKLFRLLVEIVVSKGKRLMIDEIDTGIHYSRFKEFWRVVLRTAKDNYVQLFMTTHNEECLKFFVEVLLEENMKDLQGEARNITLIELPDKSVKAYTYPFDHLEANLSVGNEIRGGNK